MAIEVSNVTKLYGEQRALNQVSFKINTGEIVGFLGPNGAGKSTMMKIITGVIPASQGEVFVEGLNVMNQSMAVKKIIGYLPENNPLYLEMYVKEYLEYVGQTYKTKNLKSKVQEMVEKTGLTHEQHKIIGALSKGYRQRVGLAQALIHDPKVLILDEPTSGLDPNQIIEIRNLISELGKEKTILLSTHIMQEVEAICDRIIILKQGTLVADNSTREIQENWEAEKQVILIEFAEKINREEILAIPGVLTVVDADTRYWMVEAASEKDIRYDLFQFAVKQNIPILSMQKKEKSLEEVFQELTKN
ncbi:MAG: gliding motility-associated ABC transporter ATP-binding subunit GldA [Bacteroidetes bacterium HGW-Bacteroidetes-4]|jgi:ABC-2 type transport system ATP-binding protein|nr:MAG: gliding motility-associated ABC transporter ATP-binding subunit GldA [Bacteroidetes bacterium HGW-Bacteroidetes-4]